MCYDQPSVKAYLATNFHNSNWSYHSHTKAKVRNSLLEINLYITA